MLRTRSEPLRSCRIGALRCALRQKLRHGVRNIQRLAIVKPRIAVREIAAPEVLARQLEASADTFRHVGSRDLQVHSARIRTLGCRNSEEAPDLRHDITDGASLHAIDR